MHKSIILNEHKHYLLNHSYKVFVEVNNEIVVGKNEWDIKDWLMTKHSLVRQLIDQYYELPLDKIIEYSNNNLLSLKIRRINIDDIFILKTNKFINFIDEFEGEDVFELTIKNNNNEFLKISNQEIQSNLGNKKTTREESIKLFNMFLQTFSSLASYGEKKEIGVELKLKNDLILKIDDDENFLSSAESALIELKEICREIVPMFLDIGEVSKDEHKKIEKMKNILCLCTSEMIYSDTYFAYHTYDFNNSSIFLHSRNINNIKDYFINCFLFFSFSDYHIVYKCLFDFDIEGYLLGKTIEYPLSKKDIVFIEMLEKVKNSETIQETTTCIKKIMNFLRFIGYDFSFKIFDSPEKALKKAKRIKSTNKCDNALAMYDVLNDICNRYK